MITLEDIRAARGRLGTIVRETLILPSSTLEHLVGVPVALKCEHLQRTGSFKIRGATNMLATMQPLPTGVIAASAGNHAQGVALAASELGIPAHVLMPASAPLAKQEATRGYGASVEIVPGTLADAIRRAERLASERGLRFIPPFDAAEVVAGQGTVGLEILDQVADVATVVVPAGGGGLLGGVACAIREQRPDVRVIGVQSAAMPGIARSLQEGRPTAVAAVKTLADGAAVAGPSALTLELIRRYVDAVVTVSERSIARAMLLLIERTKQVVEGAGALGVAALLEEQIRSAGPIVVVLSGGNVDINLLDRIVERGLVTEGRRQLLTVAASNTPGELANISAAIAAAGANVVEVRHELVTADLPVGVARLVFHLDVAGRQAFDELIASLLAAGMRRGARTDLMTEQAAAAPE